MSAIQLVTDPQVIHMERFYRDSLLKLLTEGEHPFAFRSISTEAGPWMLNIVTNVLNDGERGQVHIIHYGNDRFWSLIMTETYPEGFDEDLECTLEAAWREELEHIQFSAFFMRRTLERRISNVYQCRTEFSGSDLTEVTGTRSIRRAGVDPLGALEWYRCEYRGGLVRD